MTSISRSSCTSCRTRAIRHVCHVARVSCGTCVMWHACLAMRHACQIAIAYKHGHNEYSCEISSFENITLLRPIQCSTNIYPLKPPFLRGCKIFGTSNGNLSLPGRSHLITTFWVRVYFCKIAPRDIYSIKLITYVCNVNNLSLFNFTEYSVRCL